MHEKCQVIEYKSEKVHVGWRVGLMSGSNKRRTELPHLCEKLQKVKTIKHKKRKKLKTEVEEPSL